MVLIVKIDIDLKPVADLSGTFMIKSIHEDAVRMFPFQISNAFLQFLSRHHFQ